MHVSVMSFMQLKQWSPALITNIIVYRSHITLFWTFTVLMFIIFVLALINRKWLALMCAERGPINRVCHVWYIFDELMLCFEVILCRLVIVGN